MKINNSELKNELNKLAGDYEAFGLDISDILKMTNKLEVIGAEINDLKKSFDFVMNIKNEMLNKLGIQSEEKE